MPEFETAATLRLAEILKPPFAPSVFDIFDRRGIVVEIFRLVGLAKPPPSGLTSAGLECPTGSPVWLPSQRTMLWDAMVTIVESVTFADRTLASTAGHCLSPFESDWWW